MSRNPFGAVAREGTPFSWVDGENDTTVPELWAKLRPQILADSQRIATWGDRWPDSITPGDLAPLRCAGSRVRDARGIQLTDAVIAGRITDQFARRLIEVDLRRLERTYASELVYIEADAAAGLLGSHRPDPDLYQAARLPWRRCLVIFGCALRFDAASTRWDLGNALELEKVDAAILANNKVDDNGKSAGLFGLWTGGGALYGVGLGADREGKLDDWVMWHVYTLSGDTLTEPTVQIGRLSQSTLAPLIENLLCALTWGKYTKRQKVDLPANAQELRKLVRTGSFRRKAKTGDVDGVTILNLTRHEPSGDQAGGGDDNRPRRTVTAHLRRGHWRRVRVITRDPDGLPVGRRDGQQGVDWNYAGRWIQPVVVTGAGTANPGGTRIYRLPEPVSDQELEQFREIVDSENRNDPAP